MLGETIALLVNAIVLLGETIALSVKTIALSGKTIALLVNAITLSGKTIALSGETIVLSAYSLDKQKYLQSLRGERSNPSLCDCFASLRDAPRTLAMTLCN